MSASRPDLQPQHLRDALWCGLGCTLAMAAVGWLSVWMNSPLLFPAIGASAFLAFWAPQAALSSPRNAFLGHAIGASVGAACAALLGVAGDVAWLASAEPWRAAAAASLALGVTSAAMSWLRLSHPPAGATTLIMATGIMHGGPHVAAILASVIVVATVAGATHRLRGRAYPLWAPRGEAPGS